MGAGRLSLAGQVVCRGVSRDSEVAAACQEERLWRFEVIEMFISGSGDGSRSSLHAVVLTQDFASADERVVKVSADVGAADFFDKA